MCICVCVYVCVCPGDDHKLTPAYLLCLVLQHSASSFPGCFGKLLLKIARRVQTVAWVGVWGGVGWGVCVCVIVFWKLLFGF